MARNDLKKWATYLGENFDTVFLNGTEDDVMLTLSVAYEFYVINLARNQDYIIITVRDKNTEVFDICIQLA